MSDVEQNISGLMEADMELMKRRASKELGLLWGLSVRQSKRRKRKKLGKIGGIVIVILTTAIFLLCQLARHSFPDTICLYSGESSLFSFHLPVTGEILAVQGGTGNPIPKDKITIHFNKEVLLGGDNDSSVYHMAIKLFGLIPVGNVDVKTISKVKVIPMGVPIGVYLKDTGILVVGTGSFTDEYGKEIEPAKDLLYSGDYIVTVNGTAVSKKSEVMEFVANSRGETLHLKVRNSEGEREVAVMPRADQNGVYKLGVWLRDNAQGIGTMTYLEPDGNFGAFGHGLSDTDTKELIEMEGGSAYETEIVNVKKGLKGQPGELTGRIAYDDRSRIATVQDNLGCGVFGTVDVGSSFAKDYLDRKPVEIALKQEVSLGQAYLYSAWNGEPTYYEIEILKVSLNDKKEGRGITFQVTDQNLLNQTGGIVQGMSGSPLLQNGKLIGAVTHVFVEDPTKGYAIFIENMIEKE